MLKALLIPLAVFGTVLLVGVGVAPHHGATSGEGAAAGLRSAAAILGTPDPIAASPRAPIKEATPRNLAALPPRLSDLALFRLDDSLAAASDVIGYDVLYPLWSDGAEKHRHIYLPPGARIDVDPEGQFDFPDGTIATKTFMTPTIMTGRRHRFVETRAILKKKGRWEFATYIWNDAGTDAQKTAGKDVVLDLTLPGAKSQYVVPGRITCMQCHAGGKDVLLGFAPFQLDDAMLERLERENRLPMRAAEIPNARFAADNELERAALGYMGGNCAHCHNPNASAYSGDELDLRPFMAKEETIHVGANRLIHPLASELVVPGRPDASVLARLVTNTFKLARDSDREIRMPPIGNAIVDTNAVSLIRDWILSLSKP